MRLEHCLHSLVATLNLTQEVTETMNDSEPSLEAMFDLGHDQLLAGFDSMIDSLRGDEFDVASHCADRVDQTCGAHIEFEQRYLYPEVERNVGEAFATQLYDRHDQMISTIVRLSTAEHATTAERAEWRAELEKGRRYAIESHRLFDHLSDFCPTRKNRLLAQYRRLQSRGHRWSQLHPNVAAIEV